MLRIEVQDLRSAPAPIQHSSLTHARLHPRETAPLDVTTPVTTGLSAQLFNHSELRKLSLSFKTILHSFLHLRPLQSEIYLLITAYAYICRHLTSLTQAIALHRHTIWTYSGATIGRMVKDVTRGGKCVLYLHHETQVLTRTHFSLTTFVASCVVFRLFLHGESGLVCD